MSAVAHLDKYNITHRDIKPENVFINNGVFKLGKTLVYYELYYFVFIFILA